MNETTNVLSLDQARLERAEFEDVLEAREQEDLRALLSASPAVTADRLLWWQHTRRAEPYECAAYGDNVVVIVVATVNVAQHPNLHIERTMVRTRSGEPTPLDGPRLAEMMRAGELEYLADAPMAKAVPGVGVRFEFKLVACGERARSAVSPGVLMR